MEQFTYSSLKKSESRSEMLDQSISRLGTQSGNYGVFNEQARVVTLKGAVSIECELMKALGKDAAVKAIENSPTLKELLA